MEKTNENLPEPDFDDYDDEGCRENCANCGRHYDDIDFDYQICSKCGWDDNKKAFGKSVAPSNEDYMNGDADILTGEWF